MGRAGLCLLDRVTDTSKAISVKGIPHNKSYRTMFLRLSLNNLYLTDLCFEKYNKKKIGHRAGLEDMMGQSYPI